MAQRELREGGRVIVAHGEVTGHTHEVVLDMTGAPPDLTECEWFDLDGRRELIVLSPCVLQHQEHDAMRLFPDGSAEKISNRTGEVLARKAYPAQLRQGDVLLDPLGPGVWRHVHQVEMPRPDAWTRVAD